MREYSPFFLTALMLAVSCSHVSFAEPANVACDCWDGTVVTTSPQCTCRCSSADDNAVAPYCAFSLASTTQINIVFDYTHLENFSAGVTEIEFMRQIETDSGSNGTFSFVILEDQQNNLLARAYSQRPVVGRFLTDGSIAQRILNGVNSNNPSWTTNLNVVTAYPFVQDPAPAENLRGFVLTGTTHIYDVIWMIFIVVVFCCCCCECCCFFTNTERKAQEKANLMAGAQIVGGVVVEQPPQFNSTGGGVAGGIMPVMVVANAADTMVGADAGGNMYSPANGEQQWQGGGVVKEQPEMVIEGGVNQDHTEVGEQQESAPPGVVGV